MHPPIRTLLVRIASSASMPIQMLLMYYEHNLYYLSIKQQQIIEGRLVLSCGRLL